MHELVRKAQHFATQAHARIDQRRKYTGQPYDVHLSSVAKIVESVTDAPETISAAWLHDVVEDTPATFQEVEREFGRDVAQLVLELTDVSRPRDGNRAVRKAIDRAHLSHASPRAQTVKLADLIDNCTDIVKHDHGFGRVFVVEMAALLEVLGQGDPALMKRARKVLEKSAGKLDVPLAPAGTGDAPDDTPGDEAPPWAQAPRQQHAWSLFARVFATRDVARPLRSFDAGRDALEVAELARELDLDVVGIRQAGATAAYALCEELREGSLESCARPFLRDQTIDGDASLTEMIQLLTRHDHGFVTALGEVHGLVTRSDVHNPLVRMWLFGMITLTELTVVERIRARWPGEAWTEHVTKARLEAARELQAERQRRGQSCDLLDCLQLADKAGLLIGDDQELAYLGFDSRKAAKRVVKELQSLRNNLAHAQDIVTDWPQIARMTGRVEEIVRAPHART